MRIISKFHDFYDVVQKQGMDRDIVYLREPKDILIKRKYELGYWHRDRGVQVHVTMRLLGYCGQIIHVFEVIRSYYDKADTSEFYFGYDAFKAAGYGKSESRYKWWKSDYQKFMEQDVSSALALFHEHQVPLFLIELSRDKYADQVIHLNPSLKKLDFQKFKDPYTAYQDIFQYVSGVLNSRENYMVKVSDKDKIAKHGFNEWSFRKLPGGKKRRK
jgi:hypothetical protein